MNGIKRTTLRLPQDVFTKIEAISDKTGICETDLIRISISEYLQKWDITGERV